MSKKAIQMFLLFAAIVRLNVCTVAPDPDHSSLPNGFGKPIPGKPRSPDAIMCNIPLKVLGPIPDSATTMIIKTKADAMPNCPPNWGATPENTPITPIYEINYKTERELNINIKKETPVAGDERHVDFHLPLTDKWPGSKVATPVVPNVNTTYQYRLNLPVVDGPAFIWLRNVRHTTIFDTRGRNIIISQWLSEISTSMQNEMIYGLGERRRKFRLSSGKYTLWTKDQYAVNDNGGWNSQSYSFHPMYLHREKTANIFHISHIRNPTGAAVTYIENESLKWQFLTGQLELYFWFADSDPEVAIRLYHEYVNGWILHPFWAGGWFQSKHEYQNSTKWRSIWQQYIDNKIPIDAMNTDIEYMILRADFTFNHTAFLTEDMKVVTNRDTPEGIHWVPIMDAGIEVTHSIAQEAAALNPAPLIMSGYKKNGEGTGLTNDTLFHGCVWPGLVYFFDFEVESSFSLWAKGCQSIEEKAGTRMSGMWLDMNELANFVRGEVNAPTPSDTARSGCYQYSYDPSKPLPTNSCSNGDCGPTPAAIVPYLLDISGTGFLEEKVISLNAIHNGSQFGSDTPLEEYLYHNINGHMYVRAMHDAFVRTSETTTPPIDASFKPWGYKLIFILSRCTMFGSGRYGQHWTGDNSSTWDDFRYALAEIQNFNMYGIPFSGPDVCGFADNAEAELCARWHAIAPWYTFARNHASSRSTPQEPFSFPNHKYVLIAAKYGISLRYKLMKYHYTQYLQRRGIGQIIRPVFHLFPHDSMVYDIENQYMFADVLVSQVSVPGDYVRNTTKHTIYLPNDQWFDFNTGEGMAGPAFFTRDIAFSALHPAFIRGGSIAFYQPEGALRSRYLSNRLQFIVALKANKVAMTYTAFGYVPTKTDLNDGASVHEKCVVGNCVAQTSASITWGSEDLQLNITDYTDKRGIWGGIESDTDAKTTAWDGGFVIGSIEFMGLPGHNQAKVVVKVDLTIANAQNLIVKVPKAAILARMLTLFLASWALIAIF